MERPTNNSPAGRALKRSNIYSFLAGIYREETSAALLKEIRDPGFVQTLSDMGVNLGDDILNGPEEEVVQDLSVEYTRLLLGPGKHVSPFESVQHERADGDWGRLWGADTVAVKKFIEAAGLEYRSDYEGLPDHIGVELEFMHKVTGREAQAWEEEDKEGALYCLKIEQKFIEEHLGQWVPGFCEQVIEQASMPFYREMAEITREFIDLEKEEIEKHLSRMQS